MSRTEKFLPFILATVAPVIGAITTSTYTEVDVEWLLVTFNYGLAIVMLLIIWYINKWSLSAKNTLKKLIGLGPSIAIINLSAIIPIAILSSRFIPKGGFETEFYILIIRLILVALVFNVILRVFKTQKERTKLEVQNLSLQAENLKFQVETLKQQINPHFLFNSLNTLLDLIEEDQEAAASYVRNFSNLYRIVLQSAKHDFIPLEDELSFLKDYWNLLKVRFGDAIDLAVEIDDTMLTQLIPPLSLQFLIENAVKHNEALESSPLVITIKEKNGRLVVSNKMNPIRYPTASEKVGLKNLQQRFSMLYTPITYGERDDKFIVELPLKSS